MNAGATRPQPREIFVATLKLSSEEWPRHLDQVCGEDRELRQRVQELLDAHLAAGSFLAPASPMASTLLTNAPPELTGTMIGPYKLLEQIGSGGMGAVFMAEQKQPVRRTVALKVIKPGMDTHQVVARFEAERQALAMMSHPNIAKVLDAGATAAGRPYFVMELVKGTPITEFCDQRKLTTRQRLQLFIAVCQAVQHAHQKGLVHRDLKPGNVLVEVHDVTPVPKVIDFGVAKAIGQQLTDKTLHTGFSQVVGTPLYMSPEQAGQSSIDIDTRSDVYSLGVLLYELLTGHTPFDKETFSKVGFDEMRRMIREDEPPRPSHRISTLAAQARSTVSNQRGMDDRQLSRALHGELDWIVMKALEKDRNRRYESASAIAADVQRYINDEPIEACAPSFLYRTRKYVRRNQRVVITTAVILSLIAFVASIAVSEYLETQRRVDLTTQQVYQSLAGARTAVEARNLHLAGQRLAEANTHLGDLRSSLPLVSAEVDKVAAQLVRCQADLDRFEQFVRLARDAQDRIGYGSEWRGDRQALEALEIWGVTTDPNWHDRLNQSFLTTEQCGRVTETAYETAVLLAGCLLSEKSDVGGALELLDNARSFHEPTRALWLVRNHALLVVKDEHALLENDKRLRSTVGRSALDHFIAAGSWTRGTVHRTEDNISAFQAALRVQPDHFNSLFYLGREFALRANRVADAIGCFTACIALRPTSSWSYGHRGRCYWKVGNLDEAHADFTAAVGFATEDHERVVAFGDRASLYYALGSRDAADRDIDSCLRIASASDSRAATGRSDLAFAFDSASWSLVTNVHPDLLNARHAVELAEVALRYRPLSYGIWTTLGVARYRSGDWQGAEDALRKSNELQGRSSITNELVRAMAEWKQGRQDNARCRYDTATEQIMNNHLPNATLQRFRAEAAELLGISKNDHELSASEPDPVAPQNVP